MVWRRTTKLLSASKKHSVHKLHHRERSICLLKMSLHDNCDHGEHCCYAPRQFQFYKHVVNFPTAREYNSIPGEERVVFHGTFMGNAKSILENGFIPEMCTDPSFGNGIYMSSCPNMASGFAGVDGLIFICRVKLGTVKEFDEYVRGYVREDQHSNHRDSSNEYVIYEGARILPVALISSD